MSTHLFNGCARLLDRHNNVVFAQLAQDGLYGCFIADAHHIPLGTLRIGLRAKGPHRSILVSDIAPMAGLADGEYQMEGNAVVMRDGAIRVKEGYKPAEYVGGLLSGAARTLDQDVEILARESEPGIEAALLMATRNPAAAVCESQWAELAPRPQRTIPGFSWDGTHLALETRLGSGGQPPRAAPASQGAPTAMELDWISAAGGSIPAHSSSRCPRRCPPSA